IDANSLDVFHHQVRKSVGRRSAVDQSRDVGMVEASKYLALQAEAAEDFLRVHSALHQLDGDALLELVVETRGQPYGSHASAADALLQLVGSHPVAGRVFR